MRWDSVSGLLDDPKTGAELGLWDGAFTEPLLKRHPNLTMYAVDVEIRPKFRQVARQYPDRVIVLNRRTVDAAEYVPDGSLDFVFIDADHSYEAVAADIDAWRSKVKPGGILSGHDYGHIRFPGVARAVDERFAVQVLPDNVWWVRC